MAVSDFLESFPKVSSNHCFSDSSNGLLRVLRTSRRSSGGRPRISFSIAYNPAMRCKASDATGIYAQLRDCKKERTKNTKKLQCWQTAIGSHSASKAIRCCASCWWRRRMTRAGIVRDVRFARESGTLGLPRHLFSSLHFLFSSVAGRMRRVRQRPCRVLTCRRCRVCRCRPCH